MGLNKFIQGLINNPLKLIGGNLANLISKRFTPVHQVNPPQVNPPLVNPPLVNPPRIDQDLEWHTFCTKLCNEIKPCFGGPKESYLYAFILFIFIYFWACASFCGFIYCTSDNNEITKFCFLYCFIFVCLVTVLVAGIFLFYKHIQLLSGRNEKDAKLKEKMMDALLTAFNEDREYNMLQTKIEISLYEKRARASIEQWERNIEHEREIDKREHERIAKLSDGLIELAKEQMK